MRLTNIIRRYQDRVGTCRRLTENLRRCPTVRQTGGAPAGDSQTACNGATSLPDRLCSCRRLPVRLRSCQDRLGTYRRLPDGLLRCQDRLGTHARDSKTVCDGARQSPRPAEPQQETPRQFATVPDCLQDRRGTCSRLPDSVQRCHDRVGTCIRLSDALRLCQDSVGTGRRLSDSLRQCKTVSQTDTPRQFATVQDSLQDRRGTCRSL
ncbi:hypothetical protein DPMN_097235 [Dreissena polymorpha]|uniref:Uncharacterized protein n=1 Tax=Dreissena polymorpha TaxID=45954 RepID=A0A9D4R5J3_DREPO|nr:hypothetical protein DPMN_097235 [Dreissena polymorpha]